MSFKFNNPAESKEALHCLICLVGGSSTGKTYSAMQIATGLSGGEPFGMIDTEAGRSRHYKHVFDFRLCDFSPVNDQGVVGYPPDRYIEVIDDAEKAGFPCIVIDSFSHVWEGINGVLEMQAAELDKIAGQSAEARREKLSVLAWAKVKPKYRRLLERLIQCRSHVILCCRAKERIQQRDGSFLGRSKLRREDLAWEIAADKDLAFEMTASLLLTPDRVGVPTALKLPDELSRAFPSDKMISPRSGEILREWSESGGKTQRDDKALIDRARAEAGKGFEAINTFWKGLSPQEKDLIRPMMAELKQISDAADRGDDELPFTPGNDATADEDPEYAAHQARVKREVAQHLAEKEGTTE